MGGSTKTVVLTGGGRGLGRVTAEKLAAQGHRVILTARSPKSGAEVVMDIQARHPGARVELAPLNLSSLEGVRTFAKGLLERGEPIDVLFHNAGVMQQSPERRLTADGLEETLGVNVLAPYLLTHELWPLLERSRARVVCVSSRMHMPGGRGAPVRYDFDDPQLEKDYDHDRAYKNSKLALLWFTYELARRAASHGVTVNAVCPGFVPVTAAESVTGFMRFFLRHVLVHAPFAQSVDDATDSFVFMAVDPSLDGVTGKFYGEKKVLESSPESHEAEKARRFWDWAARTTGVDPAWP
jgi:NAD(P)-dependent dehydrogenase (short-subunit alcohol dehydrogenase family)